MDIHERFHEWAIEVAKVEINGIVAHRFEGRGLGIIAERGFEPNKKLLTVPLSALRTIQTVPKCITSQLPNLTTHGLLATELCLDTSPTRSLWNAVLPTREDFAESIPLMWDSDLQNLLPEAAKELLENQKRKLEKDWGMVKDVYGEKIEKEEFVYRWLIVNTRTFYYLDPAWKGKEKQKPARDDCMALNPFADYFNHSSTGCTVSFDTTGYTITTPHALQKGAEIYISYGNHSNDFLLTEYGFIMPAETNTWDEMPLSSSILPLLSPSQTELLQEEGFLGKYVLDKDGVCYRTQVALRILCLPLGRWRRFVAGGDEGVRDQEVVDEYLVGILRRLRRVVGEKIGAVKKLKTGLESQREVLGRRWVQIDGLLESAIKRIEE
ncbi:hypothetical protein HYALB_00000063 [Hymenoscyphus albidus]|uniref:SET domain-containing protein n=1 Tax=Hymenoscyphus albidus TaxID=595503 RepID=A0A9N9LIP3_9HELO|nr:hypothetical protein HYALB_00000063 [Hymenoscyphus albidus]